MGARTGGTSGVQALIRGSVPAVSQAYSSRSSHCMHREFQSQAVQVKRYIQATLAVSACTPEHLMACSGPKCVLTNAPLACKTVRQFEELARQPLPMLILALLQELAPCQL